MAQQREWPRARLSDGTERGSPTSITVAPDGLQRSNWPVAGPLRMGTAPGVGPKGRAVTADYDQRSSDMGMDMIARDRKLERKFPSGLVSKEVRDPHVLARRNTLSEGKLKPK